MYKVGFFCVGAGKAGTTWLWSLLRQHPSIMLPSIKEMHYFNSQSFEDPKMSNPLSSMGIEWYHKHFDLASSHICGDFTPSYIWDRDAIRNIYNYNPRAKIIVILRDPFERTVSQFNFAVNQGRIDDPNFDKAIIRHPFLIRESLYYEDMKKIVKLFKDNILVLRFEALTNEPLKELRRVEHFLAIKEANYNLKLSRENAGGRPKYRFLVKVITTVRMLLKKYGLTYIYLFLRSNGGSFISRKLRKPTYNMQKTKKIDAKSNPVLNESFNRDIEMLEDLLNWDLKDWYGYLND